MKLHVEIDCDRDGSIDTVVKGNGSLSDIGLMLGFVMARCCHNLLKSQSEDTKSKIDMDHFIRQSEIYLKEGINDYISMISVKEDCK